MKNSKNAQLRALLQQPGILRAVGAGDPWDAKLIEQAGFSAVYMSGAFVSHITLGRPDIGLATQSEMVNAARKIAAAVSVPVIADGDNGFGGVLNVMRTVMEYEQAGVSAIQLEDQVFPKRCGHMEGKALITREEMEAKIRAAAKARQDSDFVIIARTDARAVNGFEDAIARAKAYADAGADVIFFEAPQSEDEMRQLNKLIGCDGCSSRRRYFLRNARQPRNLGSRTVQQFIFNPSVDIVRHMIYNESNNIKLRIVYKAS